MKQKSLKVNYFYNMIFTCLNLIFPLITAPYVSRVLGPENLGKVNFATAFANWFILLSAFGTIAYGVREVAKVKEDKDKLNKLFSELLVIKFFITLILIIVYFFIIITIGKFSNELNLYLIFSVNIMLNIFNIDWFYQGIENYRYITVRSGALKLISLIAMFLMVKHPEDYILYGAISIFASSFGNVLNYLYSRNFVCFTLSHLNIKRHLNRLIILFISSILTSCYSTLDQLLVGFLVDNSAVAFVTRSKQVTSISTSLTLALNTVIIPRATFYYKNDKNKYNSLIFDSINYIYILALPCMVGIMFLSKEIMMLLGGIKFLEASPLLSLMSINILVLAIGTWNYNQILLPTGNEKKGLKTITFMAIISITCNFMLIRTIGYIGVGISWVATEIFGMITNLIYTKKIIKYKILTNEFLKYIISTFIVIITIILIKFRFDNYLVIITLSLIICPSLYFSNLILLKEKYTMQMLSAIKGKLLRYRN